MINLPTNEREAFVDGPKGCVQILLNTNRAMIMLKIVELLMIIVLQLWNYNSETIIITESNIMYNFCIDT